MKIKKVTEMLAVAGMMFLSGASQHAYGQAEKTGNGGNGVVCFQDPSVVQKIILENEDRKVQIIPDWAIGQIESIEALDIFESKSATISGVTRPIKEIKTGEKVDDYFERLVKPFEDYVSNLRSFGVIGKNLIRTRVNGFENALSPLNDFSSVTQMSDRCVIATIINQKTFNKSGWAFSSYLDTGDFVGNPGKYLNQADYSELTVDLRLYNHVKHSETSKAVLMIHEWYYSSFLRMIWALENSDKVRKLISYLITDDVFSVDEFYKTFYGNADFLGFPAASRLTKTLVMPKRLRADLTAIDEAAVRNCTKGFFIAEKVIAEDLSTMPKRVQTTWKQLSQGAFCFDYHTHKLNCGNKRTCQRVSKMMKTFQEAFDVEIQKESNRAKNTALQLLDAKKGDLLNLVWLKPVQQQMLLDDMQNRIRSGNGNDLIEMSTLIDSTSIKTSDIIFNQ